MDAPKPGSVPPASGAPAPAKAPPGLPAAAPVARPSVYWPTVAMGVAAVAVLGASVLRHLARRQPPEPEPDVVFSQPAHSLAAPPPSALRVGRPLDAPADAPDTSGSGLPPVAPPAPAGEPPPGGGSFGFVRGEEGAAASRPPADPFTQEGDLGQAVGLGPSLSFTGQGGPAAFTTQVLRNENEWRQLWKEIAHGKPPAVDFKRSMLVAVFAGRQSTSLGVRILSAAELGGKLRVVYDIPQGRPTAAGKQWKPYHILAVPKTTAAAVFSRRKA